MQREEIKLRPGLNEPFIISYLGQQCVYEIVKAEGKDLYILVNARKGEARATSTDLDKIYATIDQLHLGGLLQLEKHYFN